MIQSLRIRNIVLIEHLSIDFHSGMQVLSGETGAGKSIVVDAVNLILGNRADRGLIRSGCEKASVEAVFSVAGNREAQAILDREGIEAEGETISIWREITASGRNLCRIYGIIVPLGLLKELGGQLMDIHGQHEHQFLMNPEMHMRFLDRTGDASYLAQMEKTAAACESFLAIHRQYARLRRESEQKQRRMEELTRNLQELHEADLKEGEEETLKAEQVRLMNAERISGSLRIARDSLMTGETEPGCLEKMKRAVDALDRLNAFGEDLKQLHDRCESLYYETEEIAFELSGLLEKNGLEPGQLEKTEERLEIIRKLERKYGPEISDVLKEKTRMEEEYQHLCALEDTLEETARRHKQLLGEYRQESRILSEMRRELAKTFEMRMHEELKELGMEKTVFRAAFSEPDGEKKPMPRPVGDDRMEFLISPNPGEALKPLPRIASGGELSRLMLAMKTLETENSGADCMVFDEIDTGISGRMAQAVSEKMIAISRKKQVICVTHLPQIAAAADHQFLVSKRVNGENRTETTVEELDRSGRISEVARMISGAEGSGREAEAYARIMLDAAEQMKR